MKHLEQKIFESKNYGKFAFLPSNRDVFPPHVRKLMKAIEEKWFNQDTPIIVNAKNQIIDGQHRFEACRELWVPFLFKVSKSLDETDIIGMQLSRNWTAVDYAKHFSHQEDYAKLLDFVQISWFPISIAIPLLYNYGNVKNENTGFRKGKFKVNEESYSASLELSRCVAALWDIGISFSRNSRLINWLRMLSRAEWFDWDKLISKCEHNVGWIKQQINSSSYEIMFLNIYNQNERKKISLKK